MPWQIQQGDDPAIQVNSFDTAIDFICETIQDLNLPHWREKALLQQAQNMPRAGFSFLDNSGTLVKVEIIK